MPRLLLDYPWIISGLSLDYSWIIPVLYLNNTWIFPGTPLFYPYVILDYHQIIPWVPELSLDFPWLSLNYSQIISESSLDYQLFFPGFSLDLPGNFPWSFLDYSWFILYLSLDYPGLSLDYPQNILGLSLVNPCLFHGSSLDFLG